jgi:sec-independent protein translocase protein TatB
VPRIAALALPHYDEAMSFSETIFLFFLALIIFGPKKLPEIARQAGRILAELRRASNEFKSQIETEISHLEVQKSEVQKKEVQKNEVEKARTVLPAGQPPQGTVASLSLNAPASESVPRTPESAATLAAPTIEATLPLPATTPSNSIPPTETVAEAGDPASQASHV